MAPSSDENSLAGQGAKKFGKDLRLSQGLSIDVRAVRDLGGAFQYVAGELKKLHKELSEVDKESARLAKSINDVRGGQGSSSSIGDTKMASFNSSTPGEGGGGGGGGITNMLSRLGGGGEGGGMSGAAAGLSVAAAAVQKGMATIDARVDRGRDYALSADRMSVLYQQMTGKSQVQVQDQYRQPLTKYRLGMGGINTLLGLQASTGINAAQQASSVEAMRTYSGFSLSTGDVANMLQNLGSAPVANRMFLMGGGGLVGVGGKQNSMQSVLQNIVKTSGLTNEKLVDSAFAQGSLTRAKLTMMGVAPDMQDQVLQYARQNIEYRKKGGKGMYNAADKASRKLMGIEDNFATQAEETDRVRAAREEQFYSRQADNYADLEKQTQKLTKVFAALEDKLSGIIGQRTSHRISSSIMGTVGGIIGGIGGFIATGGNPLGAMAGFSAGSIGGTGLGMMFGEHNDGASTTKTSSKAATTSSSTSSKNDSNIFVPTYGAGNKPKMVSIESIKSRPDFMGMKSQMKDRVLRMMRANPKIGFGQGVRSQQQQNELFFQRYQKTDRPDSTERKNRTDRKYQGFWWELKGNTYPAAAPGNSMHGAGLAADLYFLDADAKNWAYAHAAEFGLAGAGNIDPPHFQPSEFANDSVTSYLKKGAPWGTDGMDTSEAAGPTSGAGSSSFDGTSSSSDPSTQPTIGATPVTGGYASISERVASDMSMLSGGGGGGGASEPGSGGSSQATPLVGGSGGAAKAGGLSGEEVARMLAGVGFHGHDLIKMLAISKRESGWDPSQHRITPETGDDSWGLFQLNTLSKRAKDYYKSKGINNFEDLLNPQTNVRMAKQLFDDHIKWFNNGFYPWGDYPNSGPGTSDGGLDIPGATAIVKKAGLGEAYDSGFTRSSGGGGGGGGSLSISGGHTFNINPSITITSSGNSNTDLRKLAKELARMVQHELSVTALRGN